MKKMLAILLAVLTVFSFTAVAASAEGEETPATGTVYKLSDKPAQITQKTDAEVIIFKDGDTIEFGEFTANTTKHKTVEIVYYPDAASISATNIKNTNWKENVVPKYNLDSKAWELEEGQLVTDLYAKSLKYYKTFYSSAEFETGEVVSLPVVGLKSAPAIGRDSANVERGVDPIDYKLDNATFVGWALYKYSWDASSASKTDTVELYALWDRGVAPEQPTNPDVEESDDPIINAMNKVLHAIDVVAGWIGAVPALLNTAVSLVIETGLRNLLYKIFGITA